MIIRLGREEYKFLRRVLAKSTQFVHIEHDGGEKDFGIQSDVFTAEEYQYNLELPDSVRTQLADKRVDEKVIFIENKKES